MNGVGIGIHSPDVCCSGCRAPEALRAGPGTKPTVSSAGENDLLTEYTTARKLRGSPDPLDVGKGFPTRER